MMFPGVSCCVLLLFCCCLWKLVIPHIQTEIFQAPVPPDILTHYREYIFFPMHLGKIKEVQIHVRYSIYLVIDVCALFEYVIHPRYVWHWPNAYVWCNHGTSYFLPSAESKLWALSVHSWVYSWHWVDSSQLYYIQWRYTYIEGVGYGEEPHLTPLLFANEWFLN